MNEEEVLKRLRFFMKQKGYSENRLALESGITQSTINSMFKKNNLPSLPTLIKICNGLGITISQFFQADNTDAFTTSQKQQFFLDEMNSIKKDEQEIIEELIKVLKSRQN